MSGEPYYADDLVTLHHGDCLDVLAAMPDHSVDAVVTDPPYGLGFMGKTWDSTFTPGNSPMRSHMRHPKTADERTVRPEEMARMCGIRVPKQDKAFSWHQFCELLGDAYDTARRQRQADAP